MPLRPLDRSLSYHALRDNRVARRIVAASGLVPPQLVVEFGAGDGTLTAALVDQGLRVRAVELDPARVHKLQERFARTPGVEPIHGDIRSVRLPHGRYAITGNIPFGLTSEVLRRVLWDRRPPSEAHLVVATDAALRWTGDAGSTVMSVMAGAVAELRVSCALRPRDFRPRPRSGTVLLTIRRRSDPVIGTRRMVEFEAFVRRGFGRGRGTVRRNLRSSIPERILRQRAGELGISVDVAPSMLAADEWQALFSVLERHRPART